MSPAAVGWIVAALAVAVALVLFARLRASDAAHAASAAEQQRLGEELAEAFKRLEQRSAESRARGEELSELRKKHDKLKRRAGDDRVEEKSAPAKLRAVEAELAAEKADARGANDEIARLHAELEKSAAELARAQAELAKGSARLAELTPLADRSQLDALERRADDGEARLAKLAAELDAARRDAAKYKGRWETLDKAYIVLRGELEMKKDEQRNLRVEVERLRALEVVLVEPDPPNAEGA
jgi:predicted  nucleic acid-binding Zn-ribbon protein